MVSVTRFPLFLFHGPSSMKANELHTEENSLSTSNSSDTPSMSPGLSFLSTVKIVTMFCFFFFQTLTFIDTAYKVCLKTRTTNQSNRPTIKQSPNKQTNKKNHTYFMYVYKTSSSYFTQPSTMSSTSRQGPLTKMATFSSACLGS